MCKVADTVITLSQKCILLMLGRQRLKIQLMKNSPAHLDRNLWDLTSLAYRIHKIIRFDGLAGFVHLHWACSPLLVVF